MLYFTVLQYDTFACLKLMVWFEVTQGLLLVELIPNQILLGHK